MHHLRGLKRKLISSSASAEKLKKEQYLKNGGALLEEFIALCDGKCQIPLSYFSATEIERAIKHLENTMEIFNSHIVMASLDNRRVLMRFVPPEHFENLNNICRDIAVTSQMSHLKNVLKLVGCCLELPEPVLVYEYVDAISLENLLFKKCNAKKSVSWERRLRIANEVSSTIVYLHSEFTTPIIHRDIKPSNVIIDQNNSVAKIMNFSYSISLPPGELEVEDVVCGTYWFVDPEYMVSGVVTQKTDVYSFGVLLFQLLTRKKVSMIDGKMKDYEQLPNCVEYNIEECNVMDIVDPTILAEERGIDIQQLLDDYLDLVKRCTLSKGEDRPYMIDVAKELRRIEKCFRVLTQGLH
ncbi:non-functional pseudokinase ZED1-like [Nicotiana tabacum]|uniref:Non-functional pseudokinase ZED1-like n=2 Tax=Nicotiana TaxID=4085 RepID=A0A1S3XB72_TOBAC|nr:PREDICTED: non-functional pseudokinase ZED1-like [Nicotiana tabacum]